MPDLDFAKILDGRMLPAEDVDHLMQIHGTQISHAVRAHFRTPAGSPQTLCRGRMVVQIMHILGGRGVPYNLPGFIAAATLLAEVERQPDHALHEWLSRHIGACEQEVSDEELDRLVDGEADLSALRAALRG